MRTLDLNVELPILHDRQSEIKYNPKKRKIIRAGRRGGKTTLAAEIAADAFIDGRRILYATPTADQLDRFWFLCKQFLQEGIDAAFYYKNEGRHILEVTGTENRIRGKTAWNADTMRGDYGDLIILDEFQDMDPDALELVVYPMLLDTNGDLVIIFTKKKGKKGLAASNLYKEKEKDERWATFHFSSYDNPYLSSDALDEITKDMTRLAHRMEILAEDIDDDPAALWNRELIDKDRTNELPETLLRIVIGVDPPGKDRTECGIVAVGSALVGDKIHAYVLDDASLAGSVGAWTNAVVACYHKNRADRIIGETNFGGDMVEATLRAVDPNISYKEVRASRGKAVRAEPVVAQYEKGRVHHVGEYPALEDEQCIWVADSGMPSPNRIDALVWAIVELLGLHSIEGKLMY